MAKRKEERPIKKVTLNLYDGDFERLAELYPRMGAGKVIRLLVDSHIRKVDAAFEQIPQPEIKFE